LQTGVDIRVAAKVTYPLTVCCTVCPSAWRAYRQACQVVPGVALAAKCGIVAPVHTCDGTVVCLLQTEIGLLRWALMLISEVDISCFNSTPGVLFIMKTLNKSLLAAAVIGAIALPGLSSAATFQYAAGKQLTFARDLFVNDGRTIWVPDNLILAAVPTDESNIVPISAGDVLTVKITLDNGAVFSGTNAASAAVTVVKTFREGTQTGGTGALGAGTPAQVARVESTAQYTAGGAELVFEYLTTGAGAAVYGPADFFLEVNSFQIANLMQSLGVVGGSVKAEITVQNAQNQPILAGSAIVARSQWGLDVSTLPQPAAEATKRIDVASTPADKTLFSPSGDVGGSRDTAGNLVAGSGYFNAGGFKLFVTQAGLTGTGNATDYVNNFDARLTNPHYNLLNNSIVTVTVVGSDMSGFALNEVWLDRTNNCAHGGGTTSLNAASLLGGTATFTAPTSSGIWTNLGVADASPNDSDIYVCFGQTTATGNAIVAQDLAGRVSLDYNIPTQRVNPDPWTFDLSPLRYNGATVYFQNVNPAGNTTAESFIRLTNHNTTPCRVVLDAKDDAARHSGPVALTVAAHDSEQLNINVLESGNDPRFEAFGGFGDGAGKWYVRVTAECTNFTASALNRNSTTGVVTDLTPQRDEHGLQWSTPTTRVP